MELVETTSPPLAVNGPFSVPMVNSDVVALVRPVSFWMLGRVVVPAILTSQAVSKSETCPDGMERFDNCVMVEVAIQAGLPPTTASMVPLAPAPSLEGAPEVPPYMMSPAEVMGFINNVEVETQTGTPAVLYISMLPAVPAVVVDNLFVPFPRRMALA